MRACCELQNSAEPPGSKSSGKVRLVFHGSGAGPTQFRHTWFTFGSRVQGPLCFQLPSASGFRVTASLGSCHIAAPSRGLLAAATAASVASLEDIRKRVAELHFEQLLKRDKPAARTEYGWQHILVTAQDSLVARLETLKTPEEVWAFAHRCLRDSHLKDVFRDFAVDDVCDVAVPEETVRSVVFPEQEHDLFDKDLEAFQLSFSSNQPSGSSFRRLQAASEQPIDLLVPESSRVVSFTRSLKSGEAAIEID